MIEDIEAALRLAARFCNHRQKCNCFICRTLDDSERELLQEIRKANW